MVDKITMNRGVWDMLRYNDRKVKTGEAKLLFGAGLPRDAASLSRRNLLQVFNSLTEYNIQTKIKGVHIMLNFSNKDQLDNETLVKISADYMKGIGLAHQPYLVYQHYDAGHPHLHIASVNIAHDGKRITLFEKGFVTANAVRKEIEQLYGLVRLEDQMHQPIKPAQGVKLERIVYGSVETLDAVSAIVSEVVGTYKYSSVQDLNAILNQFGVLAYGGSPGSNMRQHGGLIYSVLDENNQIRGAAIKSRFIYGNPSLKNLEKRFETNRLSRGQYGQRLRILLNRALEKTKSQPEMEGFLKRYGIRLVFRTDREANIMGVTYIDNDARVAFNGPELGEDYSAVQMLAAINEKQAVQAQGVSLQQTTHAAPIADAELSATELPASQLPAIQTVRDPYYKDYDEVYQQQRIAQLTKEKSKGKTREQDMEMEM